MRECSMSGCRSLFRRFVSLSAIKRAHMRSIAFLTQAHTKRNQKSLLFQKFYGERSKRSEVYNNNNNTHSLPIEAEKVFSIQ